MVTVLKPFRDREGADPTMFRFYRGVVGSETVVFNPYRSGGMHYSRGETTGGHKLLAYPFRSRESGGTLHAFMRVLASGETCTGCDMPTELTVSLGILPDTVDGYFHSILDPTSYVDLTGGVLTTVVNMVYSSDLGDGDCYILYHSDWFHSGYSVSGDDPPTDCPCIACWRVFLEVFWLGDGTRVLQAGIVGGLVNTFTPSCDLNEIDLTVEPPSVPDPLDLTGGEIAVTGYVRWAGQFSIGCTAPGNVIGLYDLFIDGDHAVDFSLDFNNSEADVCNFGAGPCASLVQAICGDPTGTDLDNEDCFFLIWGTEDH